MWFDHRCYSGEHQIPILYTLIFKSRLYPIHSSNLRVNLSNRPAYPLMSNAPHSPSSPFPLPTSPYFSSYLLACSACTIMTVPGLVWPDSFGDRCDGSSCKLSWCFFRSIDMSSFL